MGNFVRAKLAPKPIPGPFLVPLRSRIKITSPRRQMLLHHIIIQSHTQPRPLRNINPPVIDQWGIHLLLHHRRPPGHIQRMILQRQKILRSRRAVHIRHATHRSSRKVHRHRDAILFSHVADLVGLQNPARSRQIRMNLAHRMFLAQHLKRLFQINILARKNRSRDSSEICFSRSV